MCAAKSKKGAWKICTLRIIVKVGVSPNILYQQLECTPHYQMKRINNIWQWFIVHYHLTKWCIMRWQRKEKLTAITFTNVVLPEYWSPTRVNSISSFQKRLLNQSKIRWKKANIVSVGNIDKTVTSLRHTDRFNHMTIYHKVKGKSYF